MASKQSSGKTTGKSQINQAINWTRQSQSGPSQQIQDAIDWTRQSQAPRPATQQPPIIDPLREGRYPARITTSAQDLQNLFAQLEELGPGGIGPRPVTTPGSEVSTTGAGGGGGAAIGGDASLLASSISESGGDGGGGGGESGPAAVSWSNAYTVTGAPAWWKGLIPSEMGPDTEYAMLVNSMIPFMSPEDQRTAASNLARLFPEGFSDYSLDKINLATLPPPALDEELRRRYTSASRAQNALTALDNMRAAAGRPDAELGPGYAFMRDLAQTLKDFGGAPGSQQLRRQYLQQQAALDPLLAETKGDALGAFGPVARMVTQPFFSAEPLVTASKDQAGQLRFGARNPRLME